MPFDGIEPLAKLAPPYAFGNDKLAELEWLLRQDFEAKYRHQWYFPDVRRLASAPNCDTAGCAIGLALVVGLLQYGESEPEQFNMSHRACFDIFVRPDRCYGTSSMADVTALMVADAIRRYMVSGEV